jgi:hypothetical protein
MTSFLLVSVTVILEEFPAYISALKMEAEKFSEALITSSQIRSCH